jgi:anti-anti-sigma factor
MAGPRSPRQIRSGRAGRPKLRSRDARHFSFEIKRGAVIVVLSGELDLNAVPALAALLEQVLAGRPWHLVFDMTRVSFLDCAAARVITGTARSLPEGHRPVLRGPAPEVGRLLELTGLSADCEIEAPRDGRDRFTLA